MRKFQALYRITVDLDATEEKASNYGLSHCRTGGRPTIGKEPSEARLKLKIDKYDTTALIGKNAIQVYWSGEHQIINEIEGVLKDILKPTPSSPLEDLRTDIPSILLEQMINNTLREEVDQERIDKQELEDRMQLQTEVYREIFKMQPGFNVKKFMERRLKEIRAEREAKKEDLERRWAKGEFTPQELEVIKHVKPELVKPEIRKMLSIRKTDGDVHS